MKLFNISYQLIIMTIILLGNNNIIAQMKLENLNSSSSSIIASGGNITMEASLGQSTPIGIMSEGNIVMTSGIYSHLEYTPGPIPDVLYPLITHTPIASYDVNLQIDFQAEITDNVRISEARLHFRKGGEISFQQILMTSIGNTFSASISNTEVTSTGIDYYLTALDPSNHLSRFPQEGYLSIRVNIGGEGLASGVSQASGSESTAYRLISFPLSISNSSVQAVLEDDLGSYDKTKWRFFSLENDQIYKEYSSGMSFESGVSYWLIVRNSGLIIDSGPGTSLSTADIFQIPLNQGWTFIGNPFNFTIPFDNLSRSDSNPVDMRKYEGEWSIHSNSIVPFSGYAVSSDSQSTLLINPQLNSFPPNNLEKINNPDWELNIIANSKDAFDTDNKIAIIEGSSVHYDKFDLPEPPAIGQYVSLYFIHSEWDRYFKKYCVDTRPNFADGQIWDMEVQTNIKDQVKLKFEGIEDVPNEFEIKFVDLHKMIANDLRQSKDYSYKNLNSDEPRSFKLIIGSSDYINDNINKIITLPIDYTLYQNFPNPFNPSTTIKYALPKDGKVLIIIYNSIGQKVYTLLNNKDMGAGYHYIDWNGIDDSGNLVSSGIYFYSIKSGDFHSTRKMVLLK